MWVWGEDGWWRKKRDYARQVYLSCGPGEIWGRANGGKPRGQGLAKNNCGVNIGVGMKEVVILESGAQGSHYRWGPPKETCYVRPVRLLASYVPLSLIFLLRRTRFHSISHTGQSDWVVAILSSLLFSCDLFRQVLPWLLFIHICLLMF